ncbi:hypothetical protein [Streptomyces youssoufiensis]
MTTPTKALLTCTTASLAATIAISIAGEPRAWLWAAWAVLAAVTVAVIAADARRA